MALYALSDLHLSLSADKPMDIFGENWRDHDEKIKNNWINKIKEEDTILIAGDISWSMNMEEGIKELQWVNDLPGRKIFVKGNHDYWWTGITKLNNLYDHMNFIQNNYFIYEDYAICGTRGWIIPYGDNSTEHNKKIYNRELIRLKLSLDSAKKNGFKKIIVMLHYPPTNDKFQNTEIIDMLKEYEVEKVVYGHLHGPSLKRLFQGNIDGIEYIVTSADYLDFNPIKILD
ncbi:metallophosphoesterase [Haloimpatiens lingqiaonensis]|uniref:metallophosphoesterase n=1 Tax=Haloimpatiens lingqiaonensis TaxID=1380675 RepID=UPI0010FDD8D0|nr:metallophosphoesterase [Haloimpatiens lingqiaonensis]